MKLQSSAQNFSKNLLDLVVNEQKDTNVVLSPFSIFTALAMTAVGARENTLTEMLHALSLPQGDQDLHKQIGSYLKKFDTAQQAKILSIANNIFIHHAITLKTDFVKDVSDNYSANVTQEAYFFDDEQQSRTHINKWVEQKTNDLIKDLIPKHVLNHLTRLVLVNAIYFKGEWVIEFDEKNTREREFTKIQDIKTTVNMMSQSDQKHQYGENKTAKWVTLAYKGNEFSATFVLPQESGETAFQSTCDLLFKNTKDVFSELRTSEHKLKELAIPKFKSEFSLDVVPFMKKLGMKDAFSEAAKFTAITDNAKDLYISNIIHKAFIQIDEKGTEAAAATAVVMKTRSIRHDTPKSFIADRPFIFILQHIPTMSILFSGKVMDPKF
jgi:serpin B